MSRPIDTRTLGPIKVDPTKSPAREAFDRWWSAQSRRGDPARNPNLVQQAWDAAFAAGEQHARDQQPAGFIGGSSMRME
jgi:hypothetical protein